LPAAGTGRRASETPGTAGRTATVNGTSSSVQPLEAALTDNGDQQLTSRDLADY
jgi:hypothetical protein